MTGLECLRAKLREMGFTKAQTENRTVLAVLEILSGCNEYRNEDKLLEEIKQLECRANSLASTCKAYSQRLEVITGKFEKIKAELKEASDACYKEEKEYIDAFFKALNEAETPEARDALRIAQMYVNSVTVNTKYDNTAFIVGLAAILSKGAIAPMDELHKINPKIPKVEAVLIDTDYGKPYRIEEVDPDNPISKPFYVI